jgi:hypothetical protein
MMINMATNISDDEVDNDENDEAVIIKMTLIEHEN